MDPSFYRSDEKGFWGTAIRNFPPKAAVAFFRNLGVLTMDRGGYVYPMSGQAQTVLDALLRGAKRAGVKIVTGCEVEKAGRKKEHFEVTTNLGTFTGDFLILACGSKAAKATDPTVAAMSWRSSSDTDHKASPGARTAPL